MTNPIITQRAVLGMFYERLQQSTGQGWIDPICTAILRSDQDSETYAWLGQVPQMAEKAGEKKFRQLRTSRWTVDNVEYQGGIVIPKKHILYDKTDQVRVRVSELADRARSHWGTLVAPLIVAGESTACYDGQFFFDTDHEEGASGAQSNDITYNAATPTAPTATEMVYAIMSGVEQILGFRDDQGEYVNEGQTEFLVLVPHTLSTPALAASRAKTIDGGDTNILVEQDSFRLRIQATPRLSAWTDRFAIFALGGTQKPFIRQQRLPNQSAPGYDVEGMLLEMLWLDSEYCKLNDQCTVSVETERAVAYGDWKKSCLVTLT